MTDKEQIIIDGINVRKCSNLNKKDKVTCCEYYRTKCYEVSDCLFKQLARKTQECEEQENKIKKLRKKTSL